MSDRREWLDRRRNGIGGSDVAALMGLSPWTSPFALWCDKVGLLEHNDNGTEAMEFGTRVESVIAKWFEDRTGLSVHGEQMECTHPDRPWMRCTLDGFVMETHGGSDDIEDALGVAEWKSTGDGPWDDGIPAYYQCQGQWNMAVTNMPHCWFGVLHMPFGRPTFRVYELARDDADIALLIKTAEAFWFDHVVAGVPPATDGSTATTEAIQQAWEADDGVTVDADLTSLSDLAVLAATKADAKALEMRIAELENAIKARMGEATALVDGFDDKGRPNVLATWKEQARTSIDTTALRDAEPDIAAKFTKQTTSRVFRLKTPKGTS